MDIVNSFWLSDLSLLRMTAGEVCLMLRTSSLLQFSIMLVLRQCQGYI